MEQKQTKEAVSQEQLLCPSPSPDVPVDGELSDFVALDSSLRRFACGGTRLCTRRILQQGGQLISEAKQNGRKTSELAKNSSGQRIHGSVAQATSYSNLVELVLFSCARLVRLCAFGLRCM
jgi:hypothetical protein